MKRVGLLLILLAGPAVAQDETNWHLLTQSHGGTVSLIKNLTKHECEFARERAMGRPATDEEKEAERQRDQARREYAEAACKGKKGGSSATIGMSVWCRDDGSVGSYSYGGGVISQGDIKSAECFK